MSVATLPPALAVASAPPGLVFASALPVLARLHNPVWIFDIERARVHWANPAALALWQSPSLDELRGRDMGSDMSGAVAQRLRQFQHDFIAQDARFSELWTLYPHGLPLTLRIRCSGIRLDDGRMAMLCEGLGQQHADTDTLRIAGALLHTSVMITLFDLQGHALYRNPAARDAAADPQASLAAHFADGAALDALHAQLAVQGHGRVLAAIRTKLGERWHEVSARACRDAVSGGQAWLLSEVDISELKRTEARAHHLARHDSLTGLPNRNFVIESFSARLAEALVIGDEAALLFIDLDGFKHINDSMGHSAGDEILVTTAGRLRAQLRDVDLAARLGGDEFVALVTAPQIAAHVEALSRRLMESVAQPIRLRGHAVRVTPSIGVAMFPRDGADVDTLMRHADLAMYRAKERGRNRTAFFAPEMNTAVQMRMSLETELRAALERREFVVHYQPRLDVRSGRIVGAEALVRWQHPVRGLVPPGVFIAVCEDAGLIDALGAQVLEQAARQQCRWQAEGMALRMSVNLSPRQFADARLPDTVQAIVAATGCDPARMELEITESALLGPDDDTLVVVQRLRALGFGIAVDDFGTGYSNLAFLRRYPLGVLKIDRSFIGEVAEGRAITELIIAMSRVLHLRSVAEGVESAGQLGWLRDQGCDEYQGFLFSPALPPERFEALWRSNTAPQGG